MARHTIEVGEARRQLLVAAPTGAPTAIRVTMHGSTSTPEAHVRLSRMAPLAGQGGWWHSRKAPFVAGWMGVGSAGRRRRDLARARRRLTGGSVT